MEARFVFTEYGGVYEKYPDGLVGEHLRGANEKVGYNNSTIILASGLLITKSRLKKDEQGRHVAKYRLLSTGVKIAKFGVRYDPETKTISKFFNDVEGDGAFVELESLLAKELAGRDSFFIVRVPSFDKYCDKPWAFSECKCSPRSLEDAMQKIRNDVRADSFNLLADPQRDLYIAYGMTSFRLRKVIGGFKRFWENPSAELFSVFHPGKPGGAPTEVVVNGVIGSIFKLHYTEETTSHYIEGVNGEKIHIPYLMPSNQSYGDYVIYNETLRTCFNPADYNVIAQRGNRSLIRSFAFSEKAIANFEKSRQQLEPRDGT